MTAKIKLNAASGGGSFSLQAPSSSSNNRVISLPDIADGTLVTSQSTLDATKLSGNLPALNGSALTNISAGKILQVVEFTTATQVSVTIPTSSATTFYDTGISGSITPSSSSSKVFVTAVVSVGLKASALGNKDITLSITDSSNNILDGTAGGGQSIKFNETYQTHIKVPVQLLHSPNTTSSFTYKVRVNPYFSNNSSATAVFQQSSENQNRSRIILMEVAA